MKLFRPLRLTTFGVLLCSAGLAHAVDFVSVRSASAILYNAPSMGAERLYVVSRFMPLEQVVTLDNWIKVRDRSGGLYWVEKRDLSTKRYVIAVPAVVDVRAEPDLGSERLFRVSQDVALERLGATGTGWVKVRHEDGSTGYVRSSDVWGE